MYVPLPTKGMQPNKKNGGKGPIGGTVMRTPVGLRNSPLVPGQWKPVVSAGEDD